MSGGAHSPPISHCWRDHVVFDEPIESFDMHESGIFSFEKEYTDYFERKINKVIIIMSINITSCLG